VAGATVVYGIISTDTTWSGLIHVVSDVSVQNEATLTILPGTKVIVGNEVEILFGWEGSAPTLIAKGTVGAPIRFCGEAAGAGYWKHLRTNANVTPDSILENVLISGAGSLDADAEAALHLEGLVTLRGVQVQDAQAPGIRVTDFGDDSDTVDVESTSSIVADLHGPAAMTWPENSTVSSSGSNPVIRIHDAVFDRDITLRNLGVMYDAITSWAAVDNEDATIVLEAGVSYRSLGFQFGFAQVLAQGTTSDPVRLLCPVSVPNCAGQIGISSTDPSEWSYVEVEGDYTLGLQGAGPVLIRGMQAHALGVNGGSSLAEGSEDITVADLYVLDCHMLASLQPIVLAANVYLASDSSIGAGESCTLAAFNPSGIRTPYYTGDFVVESGGELTIDAGLDVHIDNKIEVEDGGSFSILGTADQQVYLTGYNYWSGLRLWSDDVTIEYMVLEASELEENAPCAAAVVAAQPFDMLVSFITGVAPLTALCISSTDTTDYELTNSLMGQDDEGEWNAPPITFVP